MTVLVVGGGITGLSAAYALGRAGVPTTLVEASARLGGKVRTERVDGFLVESGPDSFIAYRPAALELCRELGLGDAIIRPTEPRVVNVRAGGRFARLPDGIGLVLPTRLRPLVTTPMFSPFEKVRMGLDLVLPRAARDGDVAVGPFLRRRLGGALVERLAGPLIGGVYGTSIDTLSLDAVVPQLREAERDHRSLLLASLAQGRARKRSGAGASSPFVTLAGGLGQLTDALAAALEASPAVTVRMGTEVAGLERQGAGFAIRLAGGERLHGDAVVLTGPAPISAGLLDALAPGAADRLRTIPYGSTGVVSLGYRADQLPGPLVGHGFLVADGEPLSISACTWSSLKWAGRAPDGMVLLRAFIGQDGERLLAGPDAEIAAAARRDLALTMGVRGDPVVTRVARWPAAMPHYSVGHLERVAAAFESLARVPNLVLAGAAYHGVGLPDCIAQGRAAAARVQRVLEGTVGRGSVAAVAPTPLDRFPVGSGGRVVSVGAAFREELAGEGIRPGADLTVSAAPIFGGPLVVLVGRARVALARSVAGTVDVSVAGPTDEAGA
jgi:oxygen-dependent protoporphyrinogen oxidase